MTGSRSAKRRDFRKPWENIWSFCNPKTDILSILRGGASSIKPNDSDQVIAGIRLPCYLFGKGMTLSVKIARCPVDQSMMID